LQEEYEDDFELLVWDQPRRPLLWKPDILANIESRRVLWLVTYSGSETHSKEKFWRNLAEALDAKLRLGAKLIVIPIVYKARMRRKLAAATSAILDGYIEVLDHGVTTIPEDALSSISIGDSEDKLDLVRNAQWKKIPKPVRKAVKAAIGKAFETAKPSVMQPFYELLRASRQYLDQLSPRSQSIHDAVVRLSLLSEADFEQALKGRLRLTPKSPGVELYKRAHICEGIAYRIRPELMAAIRAIGADAMRDIVKNGITPTGRSALALLRQIPSLAAQASYVEDNLSSLRRREGMAEALVQCYTDPVGMLLRYAPGYTAGAGCWLFTFLKNLFATAFGRQGQEWIEEVGERSGEMRSILVGLHFPRFERCERMLPKMVLTALSAVFAKRLAKCGDRISKLRDKAVAEIVDSNLGNRLAAHGFASVWYLVKRYLRNRRYVFSEQLVPSAVSEFCNLDKKTGSTRFLRVGKTLIHCKVLTEDGRDHKVKELFARAAFTKASFVKESGWKKRSDVDKLVLVLDGDLREEDLRILQSGWWDHLFYVDQLDGLEKVLASQVTGF
jgi:hypothetical protein